jgi:hypothetical protein
VAVDEVYDGPFCVLSIVDNRTFRRLTYRVLDHSPDARDITSFLKAFRQALDGRGLGLLGVTTDGSSLYPGPLALVFAGVPHQVCTFHVIKELTRSVLRALAKVRKGVTAGLPRRPRGRPKKAKRTTRAARRRAARVDRQRRQVADLFEHRYLFVTHHLTPADRRTLRRVTRGLPQLRVLRDIMDEVYRLFDRRCRTGTALGKLARLRRRVRRFKAVGQALRKLFSPTLEKALTFLDDNLLGATSNAVERGNRRHRKMQKTVYRVRTQRSMEQRIALDLLREMHAEERGRTTTALHRARSPTRTRAPRTKKPVTLL